MAHRPSAVTWPLSALLRALGPSWTEQDVAMAFRWSGTRRRRYREHGIPDDVADRYACHFGLHPAQVWGDEWFQAADTVAAERDAYEAARAEMEAARRRRKAEKVAGRRRALTGAAACP